MSLLGLGMLMIGTWVALNVVMYGILDSQKLQQKA
jgi:hypothetical protein